MLYMNYGIIDWATQTKTSTTNSMNKLLEYPSFVLIPSTYVDHAFVANFKVGRLNNTIVLLQANALNLILLTPLQMYKLVLVNTFTWTKDS